MSMDLQKQRSCSQFKNSIEDPMNTLSGWSNATAIHHCNWTGVSCTNPAPFLVSSLNLQSLNLSGEISASICKLANLAHLNLADNLFNQPIPLHLSECGTLFKPLQVLDFSRNHVEGKIPESIGSLRQLRVLNLGSNLLSGGVPVVFGNFTELVVLDLSHNPFLVSEFPADIGELGNLEQLLLQSSGFYGEIPADFFKGLNSLTILDLSQNNLTGNLPRIELFLPNLVSFDVSQNKLSGSFPNGVCEAKSLVSLSLHTNFFNGSIPNDLINECTNLERFEVQNNGFSGNFPSWLWSLPKLKLIRAENNRFTGEIPDSISEAAQLEHVQIDNNSFTSTFPLGIGNIPEVKKCKKLVSLSLADNSFAGEIPESLADLPVLTYLDLSKNNLTGPIPQELEKLKLALFNVSYNKLSGRVPASLISGLPASFLQGNPGLCGPGLPNSCLDDKSISTPSGFTKLTCALVFTALAFALLPVFKSSEKRGQDSSKIRQKYCENLGICHSDDSIFLIYEYLPKGSLGDLISKPDFNLPWSMRLKIAIGIAQGLAYLHKDYLPHLLHRNLKSNNVLLDADFQPKLTDFALDRIIGENTFQSVIASESASSCYLAPALLIPASVPSRMWSHEKGHRTKRHLQLGVVLLELLTGRQAEKKESEEASIDVVKRGHRCAMSLKHFSLWETSLQDVEFSASVDSSVLSELEAYTLILIHSNLFYMKLYPVSWMFDPRGRQ
ncbi:UNVERIFIED_CONTAM: putative inactive leucine-rich repeat receptor-like protein kinase [Sesamum calycinum]|uniref:non-specific serine/threonine protein kinase n=1 Tax=Sesamum calycinum TaxID=2727403 RepID=A0AAW2RW60_9LAMI